MKPSTTPLPLRVVHSTTQHFVPTTTTTEPTTTTTTTTTTKKPDAFHELDRNRIYSNFVGLNGLRPRAEKRQSLPPLPPRRQTSAGSGTANRRQNSHEVETATAIRRQKSVDGGTVGSEVRNIVHSISNTGETLPEITTNISHTLMTKEEVPPPRDPPYLSSNEVLKPSASGDSQDLSATDAASRLSQDSPSKSRNDVATSRFETSAASHHKNSDDSGLITNDVLAPSKLEGGQDRSERLNAVMPREQYDRQHNKERQRQVVANYEAHKQHVQEKRRELKEKKRKFRERKVRKV